MMTIFQLRLLSFPTSLLAKTIPHGLSEPPDSLVHILRASRCIRSSEVQARRRLILLRQEPRATRNEDTALNTRVKDLLFNVDNAAFACLRVLGVVDLEPHLMKC